MLGRVAALAGRALLQQASASLGGQQQALAAAGVALTQLLHPAAASAGALLQASPSPAQLVWGSKAQGFATNSHDIFNVHKDTTDNNASTTFEWTAANLKVVQEIISHYPPNYKASAIIPVLDIAQQQNNGWLSLAAMNAVAKLLEMPEIRVYEVATFYTMFNRSKMGKYHVMVCGTTPCRLQGALNIQAAIEKHLGIHIGETTKDGMFTFSEMECMGACVNAPMIAVADYTGGVEKFTYTYYEDLTTDNVVQILEALRKGEKPRVGSQFRSKAEGAGAVINYGEKWVPCKGTDTLTGEPRGPYAPNLG